MGDGGGQKMEVFLLTNLKTNISITNNIISFEQLGPFDFYPSVLRKVKNCTQFWPILVQ